MSQHLADDVLTSLSRIAQDSAISLRELSARIDLKKDAQELKLVFGMILQLSLNGASCEVFTVQLFPFVRFKYENSGKLTDTSSPPTLLQSVHQLIEVSQNLDQT